MQFTVQQRVAIDAPPSDVWKAINDKEMIFYHFLGGLKSEDPALQDVMQRLPDKFLKTLNLFHTSEVRDNHHRIIYFLEAYQDITTLSIVHECIEGENSFHFLDNAWMNFLNKVKQRLES